MQLPSTTALVRPEQRAASEVVRRICLVKCHLCSCKAWQRSEGNGFIWGDDLIKHPAGRLKGFTLTQLLTDVTQVSSPGCLSWHRSYLSHINCCSTTTSTCLLTFINLVTFLMDFELWNITFLWQICKWKLNFNQDMLHNRQFRHIHCKKCP